LKEREGVNVPFVYELIGDDDRIKFGIDGLGNCVGARVVAVAWVVDHAADAFLLFAWRGHEDPSVCQYIFGIEQHHFHFLARSDVTASREVAGAADWAWNVVQQPLLPSELIQREDELGVLVRSALRAYSGIAFPVGRFTVAGWGGQPIVHP